MAHMSIPCHEGPPATAGHFCSEPAVAGDGRYYCIKEFNNFNIESDPIVKKTTCLRFGSVPSPRQPTPSIFIY